MAMEVVPVKLPPELKRAMIARANKEGKSHSGFMRDALIFYLHMVPESIMQLDHGQLPESEHNPERPGSSDG